MFIEISFKVGFNIKVKINLNVYFLFFLLLLGVLVFYGVYCLIDDVYFVWVDIILIFFYVGFFL